MISMGKSCNVCDTLTQRGCVSVETALTLKNDTFATQRGKKNEPGPWQGWHQSFHESECSHSSPREIINCHISPLINKIMKTVLSAVEGSATYQRALCDESPRAPGPVKGQTAAVGCRAGGSQADSDLLQPSHESSSRSSCLTLSEMTAGFQQAELFVTKQIVTNLWDKYRITRPPCFNPSFFCLLFR